MKLNDFVITKNYRGKVIEINDDNSFVLSNGRSTCVFDAYHAFGKNYSMILYVNGFYTYHQFIYPKKESFFNKLFTLTKFKNKLSA